MRVTAAVVLTASVIGGVSGCSQQDTPPVRADDTYRDVMQRAGLSYEDVVMIDMQSSAFSKWMANHKVSDLRNSLPEYRATYGDQIEFILNNPPVEGIPISSVDEVKYAAFSGRDNSKARFQEVFVDFKEDRILSGDAVIANETEYPYKPMLGGNAQALKDALMDHIDQWSTGECQPLESRGGLTFEYQVTVAVVMDNGDLYRFSVGTSRFCAGFLDIYDAFWAAAGS